MERTRRMESQPLLKGRPRHVYVGPQIDDEFRYIINGKDSKVIEEESPPEPKTQSSLVTIFVVWNTMVGTSLLTMPWGLERAGLLMGIALVMLMAALCCYTAYCVVASQNAYGQAGGEISELVRHMLGRRAELVSKIFSYIVLTGVLIIYWILMTNFLYFIVDYVYRAAIGDFKDINTFSLNGSERCRKEEAIMNTTSSESSTFQKYWGLETTVPIYLAVILGPILSFKSVTFFTKFNTLGTLSLMYLMLFVLVKGWSWGYNMDLSDSSSVHYSLLFQPSSFFATSGMLAMSYFMQNIIITIMRSNKNQENNARDLAVAYCLGMATYLVVGIIFYVTFPLAKSCIEDNMLNNFASWDVYTLVARVFLFFQLVTVFPLINFMLRYQLMTAFFSSSYPSCLHVVIFNLVVVIACVLFAIFLPRIGTIIRFTGAISGFFHVFSIPCLLRLASLKRKTGKLSILSLVLNLAIPLFGGVNLVAQFFVSDD